MAVSLVQIRSAWEHARFHFQAEIVAIPTNPATPAHLPIALRVRRCFRGSPELREDDLIELILPVSKRGDIVLPGESYLQLEGLRQATFLEAFANGEVATLHSVVSGVAVIDQLTKTAVMIVPAHESDASQNSHSHQQPWWKIWN